MAEPKDRAPGPKSLTTDQAQRLAPREPSPPKFTDVAKVIQDQPLQLDPRFSSKIEDSATDFIADERNDLSETIGHKDYDHEPPDIPDFMAQKVSQIEDVGDLPYSGEDPRMDESSAEIKGMDSVVDWPNMDFGMSEMSSNISDSGSVSDGFDSHASEFGDEGSIGGWEGKVSEFQDEHIDGFQGNPTEVPPLSIPDISGNDRNHLPEHQSPQRPTWDNEKIQIPETRFINVFG